MSSIWDDPTIKTNDSFIKFDTVGDSVAGTITAIGRHTWDDGKVSAQISLNCDDGEERTLTAGQVRLKAALVEQRPEVGDHLAVVYTQNEKRAGGKTLKHFEVSVKRAAAVAAKPAEDKPPF